MSIKQVIMRKKTQICTNDIKGRSGRVHIPSREKRTLVYRK